jgi:uncharacterized protein (TIGR02271 family)
MQTRKGTIDVRGGGGERKFGSPDVREGMMVISADGERVGKVIRTDPTSFVVEKGLFFKKDYLCRYDEVRSAYGDELILDRTMSDLRELPREYWEEARAPEPIAPAARGAGMAQETKVPLAEERLTAEKTVRPAGEVEIRKEVKTETKHVEVPVKKEEVRVSRTPVERPAEPGEAAFRETEVSIPVTEEEVEISKRPVVKEEVRATKTTHEETRAAEAQTRREEAKVEEKPGYGAPGKPSGRG